jgi:hypothetical protein
VIGKLCDVVPSEIATVPVPAAAAVTVNVPVDPPDLVVGVKLTRLLGVLDGVNVPAKFGSVAVAWNDVAVPERPIVCAVFGVTARAPVCTVISVESD